MNAETLERLLLDRALGALSPEVESLLATHLESDPEAAARAREFAEATLLARQALGGSTPAELPPFPSLHIEKLRIARRNLVLVRNIAGLAAVLILGVVVGAGLSRHFAAAESSAGSVHGTRALESSQIAASDGFWSTRRLVERAQRMQHSETRRVIWDSPVRGPKLGDVQ